jgi:dTDP-4-amino-4,6-dideoxygalactose transaminase
MDFIDLAAQQQRIRNLLEENVLKVMDHGQYIMGPEVKALEEQPGGLHRGEACHFLFFGDGRSFDGADGLRGRSGGCDFHIPLYVYRDGGSGCFAGCHSGFCRYRSQNVQHRPGEARSGHFSRETEQSPTLPPAGKQACAATDTPGNYSVDLFGLPADYDRIKAIAKEHDLFVVEDAAQAFGAEYHGKKAGSLADIACTSFFPAKPLGGYGDGGMCFTDDDALADFMISVRIHGKGSDKYDNIRVGINGRLDTFQAAVLLAKFSLFPEEVTLRQQVAERYSSLLAGNGSIVVPYIPQGFLSVWAQYSLLARNGFQRSAIQGALQKEGIPTAIYYPKPLHVQTAFAALDYRPEDFPVSADCAERIFSLPMHPYLKEGDQKKIADVINRI